MSQMGGFDVPILHGLCTYGITGKSAYDSFCGDDPSKLVSFNARFTSHVFPGETVITQFWKGNGNKILVTTKTKERGLICLVGEISINSPKF